MRVFFLVGLGLACCGDEGMVTLPPRGDPQQVAVGLSTPVSCAVTTGGAITCWGEPIEVVTQAPTSRDFVSVAIGNHEACAIRTDGSLACWGRVGDLAELVELRQGWRQIAMSDWPQA